jgi:CheY-like chemotaxis protein
MGKRILIVDDEADVVTYLTMILKSNNFEPYAIETVVSGMKEVERIKPDLICLDIMMPKETGISFYKKLRKSENYSHIPVIIVSGVVQSGKFDFRSFVKDKSIPPPERYMEKPIDVDEFIDTIDRLIAERSS